MTNKSDTELNNENSVIQFVKNLLRTCKELVITPGKMIRNFFAGDQKNYVPYYQFFLLFMLIYFVILVLIGDKFFDFIKMDIESEGQFGDDVKNMMLLVRENINIFYFILPPLVAFSIKIFFRDCEYSFMERVVFSSYAVGVAFIISILAALLGIINPEFFFFKTIFVFAYLTFAIYQFINPNKISSFIRAILTTSFTYILYITLIVLIVIVYVAVQNS